MKPEQLDNQDIKYSVPFVWGTLRVTSEADQAYGLVPLTAQMVEGDYHSGKSMVDIRLAGPEEIKQLSGDPGTTRRWAGAVILGKQEADTASITVGFTVESEQIIDEATKLFQDDEHLQQDVPQFLAHTLAEQVMFGATDAFKRNQDKQQTQLANKRARMFTAVGVSATSLMAGVDLATGNVNKVSMGILGAYSTYQFLFIRKAWRRASSETTADQPIHMLRAMTLGAIAARDVHDTYCSNVFDQNFGDI